MPVTDPAGTMTTGNRHGLLVPYDSTGRARRLDAEPAMTFTTKDRGLLVDVTDFDVRDCYFRMLDPAEVARGMSFPEGYIPEEGYTKKDRVKLAGNAVTPPVMAWIVGRLIQMLEQAA